MMERAYNITSVRSSVRIRPRPALAVAFKFFQAGASVSFEHISSLERVANAACRSVRFVAALSYLSVFSFGLGGLKWIRLYQFLSYLIYFIQKSGI